MADRQRLSGRERRAGILDAAEALILEWRLPLNLDLLAGRLGISKPLIYAHFPTQLALLNAVLERRLAEIPVVDVAAGTLAQVARRQAEAYFEHICVRGPIVHMLLRESGLASALAREPARLRDRAARGLVRRAHRELRLPPAEAVGAFTLVMTIPEEAGSLVYHGHLDRDLALSLCLELVDSSIAALRPA